MTAPKPDDFFASRSGVCVYVQVQGRSVRVLFATPDALGVAEAEGAFVQQAVDVARSVVQTHQAELLPLFERVARSTT